MGQEGGCGHQVGVSLLTCHAPTEHVQRVSACNGRVWDEDVNEDGMGDGEATGETRGGAHRANTSGSEDRSPW